MCMSPSLISLSSLKSLFTYKFKSLFIYNILSNLTILIFISFSLHVSQSQCPPTFTSFGLHFLHPSCLSVSTSLSLHILRSLRPLIFTFFSFSRSCSLQPPFNLYDHKSTRPSVSTSQITHVFQCSSPTLPFMSVAAHAIYVLDHLVFNILTSPQPFPPPVCYLPLPTVPSFSMLDVIVETHVWMV